MNVEDTMDGDGRLVLRSELSVNSRDSEGGFGISVAFENLLVHAAIARRAPGGCTGNIDHDFAHRCSRIRIETDGPSLEFEFSMHRVQDAVQGELNGGLGRIELVRQR